MTDKKDTLGDRIKKYEAASSSYLINRIPVIIRVDGRAFSSFCKRFKKPFDQYLNDALNQVTLHLLENIQGAKFAERHSDEISILVTDYDNINSSAFFDYNVQKVCSITASLAATEFCRQLMFNHCKIDVENYSKFLSVEEKWPTFDSRCFNIPESDICNYFLWRINDAIRNSISMQAQSKFSHKELIGVSNSEKQEMLFRNYGINWNDLPQEQKSGFIFFRQEKMEKVYNPKLKQEVEVKRNPWVFIGCPKSKDEWMDILKSTLPKKED